MGGTGVLLAGAFIGLQIFLLVGGLAYRKDCLTDGGKVTSDWTFQWAAPIPYIFRPSGQDCIVHTGTRVALDAVGVATFQKPSTLSIADSLSDSTDGADLAYFGRLKAVVTEYGNASEKSRSIEEGEGIVDDALDRLAELAPPPRYQSVHLELVSALTAIKDSAAMMRQAATSQSSAVQQTALRQQERLAENLIAVFRRINVIHAGDR